MGIGSFNGAGSHGQCSLDRGLFSRQYSSSTGLDAARLNVVLQRCKNRRPQLH
jgi:hypothetical protein